MFKTEDINLSKNKGYPQMGYHYNKLLESQERYRPSNSIPYLWARYRTLSPIFPLIGICFPVLSINVMLTLQNKSHEIQVLSK